jgi:hypothetical protein
MRRTLFAFAVASFLLAPVAAHAGWIIEGSVGKGAQVKPSPVTAEPINVMIAPGFTIPFLRFEVGLLNSLPDVNNSKYDLEIRPMLVIAPPILPLYARAIFAVSNLLHDVEIAYGAAGGLKIGLGPVGVFAEVGALPRSRTPAGATASEISWVIEGRAGVALFF